MPLAMQIWNIYRSRAIGHWLQTNGVMVIPNIRFGDRRTYRICCDGIAKKCTIAVGTYGTIKQKIDRDIFAKGLDIIVKQLYPTVIVVYGSAPESIFKKYKELGIKIIQFDSDYAASRREVV